MALPGKGSAVLQCGYPRKPDDPPAHCSVAAPDGREGRRSSHYVRRPYGSSAAAGILKQQAVTVENGQIMDLDEWKERLTALGYERTAR